MKGCLTTYSFRNDFTGLLIAALLILIYSQDSVIMPLMMSVVDWIYLPIQKVLKTERQCVRWVAQQISNKIPLIIARKN